MLALSVTLGFEVPVNFLFFVCIILLMGVSLTLCGVVSAQARRIVSLVQEVSILRLNTTETFRKTLAVTSCYCLWSAHYAPHPGGIENYTERLAHVLAVRGNRVIVVTSNLYGGQSVVRQEDGVEVFRLPCRALMNGRLPIPRKNSAYRSLLAELDGIGFDGVLVNARFYGHSLEGMKFARRNGLKPVVLDHGSAYLTLGNFLFDAALAVYEHGITALGKRYHADYYGVSQASARWLETFGIEALGVLPNAIDAEDFRESSSGRDFRTELGLPPAMKLVATVGRVAPEKGSAPLVESARLLEGDGVSFAIAGDGPLLNDLRAKAPKTCISWDHSRAVTCRRS